MAKSTIRLANGTTIMVEGSVEEVTKVMNLYGQGQPNEKPEKEKLVKAKETTTPPGVDSNGKVDILKLVNATKDADDFDQIEKNILDQASQVDRVLLPLFVADRVFGGSHAITSNDIYKYLKDFGINMALPNISKTLSKTAVKYVMGDSTRKKGVSTSYRISRRGKQYMEQTLYK
jgi:hypothetical protein